MSAPVLTVFNDESPRPRVEVFFSSFVAGTSFVTVYMLADGREKRVRGAVNAATAGSLSRIDYELVFNRPMTYRAEQFDAAGQSLGFTPSTSVTVSSVESWMHNPLDPQGAVKIILGGDSAGTVSRPNPGVVSRPLGRRVGVVLSEPRQGVTGLRLDVRTFSDEEADKVQAMFGDGGRPPVVCISLGSRDGVMRVPQPLFLSTLNVAETDISHQWGDGEIAHVIEGDEVDPPIPGLFVPLLRAKDINFSFATADDVNAAALIASGINRMYDLAGAAG
ncbi:hypothetical protein [Microbacterium aurugineum]|uniref:hypothetical protein n=1 Tax=Microbacterium aurugineum TaxID=2851642 RepID=UPI0020BEA12F|nr:hypothetical protein [Microbacterium aurugineum]MCK8477235.1 hypothetical protein [Microbacterium aurugineum]